MRRARAEQFRVVCKAFAANFPGLQFGAHLLACEIFQQFGAVAKEGSVGAVQKDMPALQPLFQTAHDVVAEVGIERCFIEMRVVV